MSDMNWRDKDDLDLTSEDIDEMAAEGVPVEVRGPLLMLVHPAPTSVTAVTVRPQPLRPPPAWAAETASTTISVGSSGTPASAQ